MGNWGDQGTIVKELEGYKVGTAEGRGRGQRLTGP